MYMYKVLNGLAPNSLNDLFVSKSDITEYDLRVSYTSVTSLQLPHPKAEKLKKSFSSMQLSFGIFCQQICVMPIRFRTLKNGLSNSDLVS